MKLLIDEKERSYLVNEGNDLHTSKGMIDKTQIDNAQCGEILKSNTGRPFHVLNPNILDFIRKAKRGPQAMTFKDMSIAVGYTALKSSSRIVEAGTGSGLFSMFLAYHIQPGKLITYEKRADFSEIAKKNFDRFGIENIVLKNQDIYEGIEEKDLDAVFLDLPEPWLAFDAVNESIKVGGYLVSYSPSINQVNKLDPNLIKYQTETFETIKRHWKPDKMSPSTRMLGHTGFLTVARKIES